jgi:acyl-CoA reductase-like NAD-dependent aldehyde dehydrogenase
MSSALLQTISPADGSVYVERPLAATNDIREALSRAREAQREWQTWSLEQRATVCEKAVQYFEAHRQQIAEEISWQMGRPIAYSQGEIGGLAERARHMISIATDALTDIVPEPKAGFKRLIRRQPLGVVFTVAPWNYPLLTTVNSVIPALMAGNSVILKPSAQTPLTGEHFVKAFTQAGLPTGVLQHLLLSHGDTSAIVRDREVDFVCFTGSVAAGQRIEQAAAGQFLGLGLELGGKDPAYVRADADLAYSVENLVDGAFFNSGQSCCGIERIYVHDSLYDEFVERFTALTNQYQLGHPLEAATSLGPVVRTPAADWVRGQIDAAVAAGAKTCIDTTRFSKDTGTDAYLAPQVLVDVDHSMSVMREESFGPVVGIMKVSNDEQALALINDSDLGLTASVWTADLVAAEQLGNQIETGTVFANRCDYLDPALAWTGVKNTGRGITLSSLGYAQLTRAKSFHFKER